VHITCALFSELYEVDDFLNITLQACPKSEKRVPKQHKHCDHCNKSGNLFNCDVRDCENYTHIYCALSNKIKHLAEDEDSSAGWSVRLIKEGQIPKITFDPNDPKLKETLSELYEKVLIVSGRTMNNDEEMTKIEIEENGSQKKKRGKKSENPKGKAQSRISLNEEDQALFNGFYDEFKRKITQSLKSLPSSSSNSLWGGSIRFECTTDRTPELYCICQLEYDDMRFMVGCDCCGKFY